MDATSIITQVSREDDQDNYSTEKGTYLPLENQNFQEN